MTTQHDSNGQGLFPWGTPDINHAARGHHEFGPSKLNAFAACPGYRPREGGTSVAAEEGTALHEWMDKVALHAIATGSEFVPALSTLVRGAGLADEEYNWLRTCAEQVDTFLRKVNRAGMQFHNELRIEVTRPDGTVVNFGHLDLLLTWDEGRKGVLFDYKFGWIPVPAAKENLQGINYALGVMQQFPALKVVGVMFVQPKLQQVSMAMFGRDDMDAMLRQIDEVISTALNPNAALRPNPYCDYCRKAGTCPALAASAHSALTRYEELPFPATFGQVEINTPADAAKALYVIGRLETHFSAAKDTLRRMVIDAAKNNDGRLEVPLAGGEKLVLESRQRSTPRSVSDPEAVSVALKDVLTPSQVLTCCDLSLGKLETLFADMMVVKAAQREGSVLEQARLEAEARPAEAKQILEAAALAAKDLRITKKEAKEMLSEVLTQEGLLKAGDGKVDYLKVRLEKGTPQLVE